MSACVRKSVTGPADIPVFETLHSLTTGIRESSNADHLSLEYCCVQGSMVKSIKPNCSCLFKTVYDASHSLHSSGDVLNVHLFSC